MTGQLHPLALDAPDPPELATSSAGLPGVGLRGEPGDVRVVA